MLHDPGLLYRKSRRWADYLPTRSFEALVGHFPAAWSRFLGSSWAWGRRAGVGAAGGVCLCPREARGTAAAVCVHAPGQHSGMRGTALLFLLFHRLSHPLTLPSSSLSRDPPLPSLLLLLQAVTHPTMRFLNHQRCLFFFIFFLLFCLPYSCFSTYLFSSFYVLLFCLPLPLLFFHLHCQNFTI